MRSLIFSAANNKLLISKHKLAQSNILKLPRQSPIPKSIQESIKQQYRKYLAIDISFLSTAIRLSAVIIRIGQNISQALNLPAKNRFKGCVQIRLKHTGKVRNRMDGADPHK